MMQQIFWPEDLSRLMASTPSGRTSMHGFHEPLRPHHHNLECEGAAGLHVLPNEWLLGTPVWSPLCLFVSS